MNEVPEIVRLPFRGGRNYVPLADMMTHAVDMTRATGGRIVRLAVSGHRMIETPVLWVVRSEGMLSPKDHDAIAEVELSDGTVDRFGYRPKLEGLVGTVVPAAPCFEADQKPYIHVDGPAATLRHAPELGAPLGSWLVAAIKTASQTAFAERGGKWIAARATLTAPPAVWGGGWKAVRVATTATAKSRFFPWDVEIDGTPSGTIVFFNSPEPT